jgi:hypothetical protein
MSEAQNAMRERQGRTILISREIAAAIDGMIDIQPSPEQIADRFMPSCTGVDELYRAATWLYLREEAERQLAPRARRARFMTWIASRKEAGRNIDASSS